MHVGSLGPIIFSVSYHDVFTWKNLIHKRTISFGEHAVMEGLPRLQHNGRKLDTITLPIVIDSQLSGETSCEKRYGELLSLAHQGEPQSLIWGNEYIGEWVILDATIATKIMHGSRILRADINVELKEYN